MHLGPACARTLLAGVLLLALAACGTGKRTSTVDGSDLEKAAAEHGVTVTRLNCAVVPRVRAETRCLAVMSTLDARKFAAAMAFEKSSPGDAHSSKAQFENGCGMLTEVAAHPGVEVYLYVVGKSPRTSLNEIWVLPGAGRICVEISHAKEA